MTRSPQKQSFKRQKAKDYMFIFADSETLTTGILFLYRIKHYLKSSLYKTEYDYRLIITSKSFKPCLLTMNEFCQRQVTNIFEVEYTKEHGNVLIEDNAVNTFGKYFFKGF